MTVCIRCHRPLKRPTETGMGATCAKKAKAPAPEVVERDLFGYDLEKAEAAARQRVQVCIEMAVAEHLMAMRRQWRERP